MAAIFLSSTCALSFVRLILMEVSLVKTVSNWKSSLLRANREDGASQVSLTERYKVDCKMYSVFEF